MGHRGMTQNGYDLYEVVSSVQKSIRRGREKEALYWCLEMCPRWEAFLWERLLIISHEDVGIADMQAMLVVDAAKRMYFELREKGKSGALLALTNAVLAMCRAEKSRVADNLIVIVNHERECGVKLEVPDEALDKHTLRGKQMHRGFDHFVTEGWAVEPDASGPGCPGADPYKQRCAELLLSGELKVPAWPGVPRKPVGAKRAAESEEAVSADQGVML